MRPDLLVATANAETEKGQDQLGIQSDAAALAQMIVLKNLTPPFTLGLIGGWGTGKSHTFHLIFQELQDI